MLNPKLLAEAFPINKVEVFFDADDHSDFLGFQWEQVSQGRVPIGLDIDDNDFNTIGKTGGEKEHILIVDEIPPHSHPSVVYNSTGRGSQSASSNGTGGSINGASYNIGNAGGGQAHNNMPPFIVMAFWRRIA